MFLVQALVFFFLQNLALQFKVTAMFAINMLVTFGLVLIPITVADEAIAYWLVITLSILFGSSCAILQAALYGLAGPFAQLMNNFNLGIGISGLSVNFLRIIVLATVKRNLQGAQIFFYTAGAYLMVCTALAYRFVRNYEEDLNSRSLVH